MNKLSVPKLLNRFKKEDIHLIVKSWSVLRSIPNFPEEDVKQESSDSSRKKKFISAVLKAIHRKIINDDDVGELDLLYVSSHPTSKNWTVFKMNATAAEKSELAVHSSETLKKKLRKELDKYKFNTVVSVLQKDEAFWILASITDNKRRRVLLSSGTYIVYYPGAAFVCIAGLKSSNKNYLFQALVTVLGGNSIERIDLEGRCVKSLMNIVLNQHSQEMKRPTDSRHPATTKRKAPEADADSLDSRIHQENHKEKRRCLDFVSKRFGDEPQPVLEKLTYNLQTKFRGGDHVPNLPEDFIVRCSIEFCGPSVLEGVKNLATSGLADIPMKNHLSRVRSYAKNKFNLVPKTNSET